MRGAEAPFGAEIDGFEAVIGTYRNDTLYGGRGQASLNGGGGDDALHGDGYRSTSDSVASGQVYRLYLAMLDRVPDVVGHSGWMYSLSNRNITLREVAEGFFGSREFQRRYGALGDTAFVTLLDRNVLGREPDETGLAQWLLTASRGRDGLVGGNLSDVFLFTAGTDGTTGMDLEPWDFLMVQGFGYAGASEVRAHMRQDGEGVYFEDQQVKMHFTGDLAQLTDDMFILA